MTKGLKRSLERGGVLANTGHHAEYEIAGTHTLVEDGSSYPGVGIPFVAPLGFAHFQDFTRVVSEASVEVHVMKTGVDNLAGTANPTISVGTVDVDSVDKQLSFGDFIASGIRDMFTDNSAYTFDTFPMEGYGDNSLINSDLLIPAGAVNPFFLNIFILFGPSGWVSQDISVEARIRLIYKLN